VNTPAGNAVPNIVYVLLQQAGEIAAAGHYGWGNTMAEAADIITKLSRTPLAETALRDAKDALHLAVIQAVTLMNVSIGVASDERARRAHHILRAALMRTAEPLPAGCHCEPGRCMAPVVMGLQTPCRDPDKAAIARDPRGSGEEV